MPENEKHRAEMKLLLVNLSDLAVGKHDDHSIAEEAAEKLIELQGTIDEFCRQQNWASDEWKKQPHIARLFELWMFD